MSLFEIIFIASGLAMDCFAVSFATGVSTPKSRGYLVLRMALFFGIFQGLMPIIGWLLGVKFLDLISRFDHWIVFVILAFLGGKMILESYKDEAKSSKSPLYSLSTLIIMSIATSIDALATGFIFVPFNMLIFQASLIIGITSFVLSFIAYKIGENFGSKFNFNVKLLGGIILIGIGTKILIEHLFFV